MYSNPKMYDEIGKLLYLEPSLERLVWESLVDAGRFLDNTEKDPPLPAWAVTELLELRRKKYFNAGEI